jgi:putative transposase
MVKIRNKRKLKWCLKQYYNGKNSQKWLSKYLGITPRRFRQIYSEYRRKGEIPLIGRDIGRPKKDMPKEWEEIVISEWSKDKLNALYLEKTIYYRYKIRIPHNTIHKIMLENGLAKEEKNKKKRRKPWIRYERKHSLSAVHLDWHESKVVPGKQVCVVLDDASRKVLSGGEFDNATAENSVNLLVEAVKEYPPIYNISIRESITDHGTQFYSEKKDKRGKANHPYENLLEKEGIKQILCGINHPQTNGKEEKWFDFYERHRGSFNNMQELINWYNNRPHGSLNLRRAETPNEAFIRKMPVGCWLWISKGIFRW